MNMPHVFWGSRSPLAGLSGAALLILASARLAYALLIAVALLWVYVLSAVALRPASRILPERGRPLVLLLAASFIGCVYLLFLWLLSPLSALELFFLVPLVPLFCAGSGFFRRIESLPPGEAALRALSEALIWGGLLIGFALIREPLGAGSLSMPGTSGIVLLFAIEEDFFPVRFIASSAGALLVLGYGAGLYRHFRKIHAPREDDL
jgi:hypothetical protein